MIDLSALGRGLGAASGLALNALLPPQCLSCGAVVDRIGQLCAPCWETVTFLAPPACAICGYPFEYDLGDDSVCGACHRQPPDFDRARAVMRYDEGCRRLLLGFKHADRTEGAGAFGHWLARAGRELIEDAELIVPVPLHWRRLLARRYNQSALLAGALGRESGLRVVPDLLRRTRATPPQGHLGAAARRRNIAGAIAVTPSRAATLQGRRVILVDDVMTTGATASACSRVLRRAGASAVDVLVLARAIRPADA
jgi:ComF family protein